jgi:uncharacterized RDD family membrane protein YckC
MPSVPNSGPAAPPPPPVWDARPADQQSLRYAGFWLRLVAAIVDGIVLLIAWKILSFFLPSPVTVIAPPPSADVAAQLDYLRAVMEAAASPAPLIAYSLLCWAYFVFQETSSAQATLGKRMIGIRVSTETGGRLSLGAASLRTWPMYLHNIAWLVSGWLSSLVLFAAFIACVAVAFSGRKQGLHDKMAGAILFHR